jgi:hypothetical protein
MWDLLFSDERECGRISKAPEAINSHVEPIINGPSIHAAQSLLYPALKVSGKLSDVVIDLRDTQYAAAIAILEGNFAETAQSPGNTDSLPTDTPVPVAGGDDGKWPLQRVSCLFPCVSWAIGFLVFSRLQGDWNWLSQEWLAPFGQ